MEKYSQVILGLIIAVALPALVQLGFTDSCANEITAKVAPIIAMLPGVIISWIGRVKMGGVNIAGFKK